MNVNPFSYLIEKLKGKVDKHDGWLNGIDANTLMSDGFYRLGVANSNLPNISTQKDWSTMYVNSDGTDASQIFISNTSRVFERVKTSGSWGSWNELALTVQPKTNVRMYGILCQKYYGKFIALFPLPNAEDYTDITPLDMGMGYKYTDPTLTWGTVHKEGNVIRIDINSGASDEHVGSFVYGHFNLS